MDDEDQIYELRDSLEMIRDDLADALKGALRWVDCSDREPGPNDSGIGPDDDEYLVCWTADHGEERVELDRWVGGAWKHRSPQYWAVIPLPSDH